MCMLPSRTACMMPPKVVDAVQRLVVIREECLPEDADYWLGISGSRGGSQPFGPQHEAAALSKLVAWQQEKHGAISEDVVQLCDSYCERMGSHQQAGTSGQPVPDPSPESNLHSWCKAKGMMSRVSPAMFGNLRGAAADEDIRPGDVLVSLPTACLISYDTALTSDLGPVLKRIPGLDPESAAVIWTMIDRHDLDSPWAAFWAALPAAFDTGLGVLEGRLQKALAGAPWLLQEAVQARQHLKEQYEALRPVLDALVRAYPPHIKPEYVTYESYLWAVELWYAYAIQVQLPGAKEPVACLVPYISLLNHSPWPHAVHFSRVDPKTEMLNVRCFRSLAKGEQAFLSYGPLPNAKLLLFYGFAVPGNPYDELPISLSLQAANEDGAAPPLNTWLHAAVTATPSLGTSHRLRAWGSLPHSLLMAARLLVASAEELSGLGLQQPVAPAVSGGSAASQGGAAVGAGQGKKKGKGSKGAGKASVAGSGSTGHELETKVAQVARKLAGKQLGAATEAAALRLVMDVVEQACKGPPERGSKADDERAAGTDAAPSAGFEAAASLVVGGIQAVKAHVTGECARQLHVLADTSSMS